MDLVIFRFLNGLTGHDALFDALVVFFASYSQYILILALVIAALKPKRRLQMAVGALLSAVVARGLVKTIIVFLWPRPRPYINLSLAKELVAKISGEEFASFPSGHALFFFALATVVYRHDKKLGRWFFAGAGLMALARVISGVHWASDVIIGAILGMLTAWVILKLIPALSPAPNA